MVKIFILCAMCAIFGFSVRCMATDQYGFPTSEKGPCEIVLSRDTDFQPYFEPAGKVEWHVVLRVLRSFKCDSFKIIVHGSLEDIDLNSILKVFGDAEFNNFIITDQNGKLLYPQKS